MKLITAENLRLFVKYGLTGAAGTLLHIAVFTGLNESFLPASTAGTAAKSGLNYVLASTLAFAASSLFVYFFNRTWVFQSGNQNVLRELIYFYAIALGAWAFGTMSSTLMLTLFNLNEYIAMMASVSMLVILNFLGRRYLVFREVAA